MIVLPKLPLASRDMRNKGEDSQCSHHHSSLCPIRAHLCCCPFMFSSFPAVLSHTLSPFLTLHTHLFPSLFSHSPCSLSLIFSSCNSNFLPAILSSHSSLHPSLVPPSLSLYSFYIMSRPLFFLILLTIVPPFSSPVFITLLLASHIQFSAHIISPFIFSHSVLALLTADHSVAKHYIMFSQRVEVIHALSHFKSKENKIKKARIAPKKRCALCSVHDYCSARVAASLSALRKKSIFFLE